MSKIDALKYAIEEQRKWGNQKVADLLCDELAKEREKLVNDPVSIPHCWIPIEEIEEEIIS